MSDSYFAQRERVQRRQPSRRPDYTVNPISDLVRQLDERDRTSNRERCARTLMRVKIVETVPHGTDVWLKFDDRQTLIVGGLLLTDAHALSEAVADQLDGALVLPARVRNGSGKALAAYLLDRQRPHASVSAVVRRASSGSLRARIGQLKSWNQTTFMHTLLVF